MIATTWVISKSIIYFVKIKILILEKLISSCFTVLGYTDHKYLFKKYRLINDLSFE